MARKHHLYQLIYCSTPFGFDSNTLNSLLIDSRENNKRDGLSGALICRSDLYLQLLEGPKEKIMSTFERIRVDDRHIDVTVLVSKTVQKRLFPDWAMKDDPVQSWMWSRHEVAKGKILQEPQQEIVKVFNRIAVTKIF